MNQEHLEAFERRYQEEKALEAMSLASAPHVQQPPQPQQPQGHNILGEMGRAVGRSLVDFGASWIEALPHALDLIVAGQQYALSQARGKEVELLPGKKEFVPGVPADLPYKPHTVRDALRFDWLQPQPTTPLAQAAGTGTELLTSALLWGGRSGLKPGLVGAAGGAIGEQLGGEAGKAIGALAPVGVTLGSAALKRSLRGPAEVAMDRVNTMERAGISPTSADISNRVGTLQRSTEQTPIGYIVGRSRANTRVNEIEDAIEGVAKPVGVPGNERYTVGSIVEQGLERWRDRFRVNYQLLRSNTQRMIPPDTPVSLPNTMRVLDEIGKKIPDEQISSLLEPQTPKHLASALGRYSPQPSASWPMTQSPQVPWSMIERVKSRIGEMAFDSGNQLIGDMDSASLRRLYRAMSDDQHAAIRALGPSALKAYERQQAYYSAGMKRIDEYLGALYAKAGHPEEITARLLSGARNDTERVRAVMKSLTPSERDDVARGVIAIMARAPGYSQYHTSAERMLTQWNNLSPKAKDALFGHNPEMRRDLDTLTKALQISRESLAILPNPSGTSPALQGGLSATAIGAAVMAGHPGYAAALASALLAAGGTSALLGNRQFVHWMAQGLKESFPASRVGAHLGQLGTVMRNMSSAEQDAFAAFGEGMGLPKDMPHEDKTQLINMLAKDPNSSVVDSATGKRYAIDGNGRIVELPK